jgi:hypothetical protein
MSSHTTNYTDTFIVVADDCPATKGEVPPARGGTLSTAGIQFDIISRNPYLFTSDEIIFSVYAAKNNITPGHFEKERKAFFSKGQPCLRSSPLAKRYGWGIHHDSCGKVALYGRDTESYRNLAGNTGIKVIKAMRSSRK